MRWLEDEAAFSFVELMVVIAIIGALSAVAVPSFLRSLPEKRLKAAARNLYADMQRARLLAVKNNKEVRVMFVTEPNIGYYYFDENGNNSLDSGEFRRSLSDHIGVDYGSGKAEKNWDRGKISKLTANIRFKPTGAAYPSGTIYLQNYNKDICYAVTISCFGNIKTRRFNGVSWDKK